MLVLRRRPCYAVANIVAMLVAINKFHDDVCKGNMQNSFTILKEYTLFSKTQRVHFRPRQVSG